MANFKDLTGKKYGKLFVVFRDANFKKKSGWFCRCDCGNTAVIRGEYLRNGSSTSCGCFQKESARARMTKHGRTDKDKPKAYDVYTREMHIKKKYGLSLDSYNSMLAQQENKCVICDYTFGQKKGDCYVDHDHESGKVRGLLCQHCNTGLGYFRDNSKRLLKASNYLTEYANAR